VTIVTKDRELIFADDANCERLLDAFREVYTYHRFRLSALVIIPDHWHALIRPYPDIVIETVVGAVKENMLWRVWAAQKRPTFWQERFLEHRLRNDDDLAYHLEYIRMNPVKHGLVERPEDYRWVFFHPRLLE
jgi:putative transposase